MNALRAPPKVIIGDIKLIFRTGIIINAITDVSTADGVFRAQIFQPEFCFPADLLGSRREFGPFANQPVGLLYRLTICMD